MSPVAGFGERSDQVRRWRAGGILAEGGLSVRRREPVVSLVFRYSIARSAIGSVAPPSRCANGRINRLDGLERTHEPLDRADPPEW